MASEKLSIKPENCIVIEDSLIGLSAAKGAKMKCVITYTESTRGEDFHGHGADATLPNLHGIKLNQLFGTMNIIV